MEFKARGAAPAAAPWDARWPVDDSWDGGQARAAAGWAQLGSWGTQAAQSHLRGFELQQCAQLRGGAPCTVWTPLWERAALDVCWSPGR